MIYLGSYIEIRFDSTRSLQKFLYDGEYKIQRKSILPEESIYKKLFLKNIIVRSIGVNKDPLISVIVPVYNAEHYLKECVASITNQTIFNLQIIIIDDGSTDGSGEICDKLAITDKRITVIHQMNSGVSAARNTGLRIARGKYIAFVDSDDILPEDSYANLLSSIKKEYLAMGRIQLMTEKDMLLDSSCFAENEVPREEFLKELFLENKLPYLGYVWDKLYYRSIIEKYQLCFDEKIKLNEDRLFVLTYLFHCKGVVFNESIVYCYRQQSKGVIFSTRKNDTVTDSEMTVIRSFEKMKKICKDYSEELYFICVRKAFECALDLLNRVSKKDVIKRKVLKKFLYKNSCICLKNPQYGIWTRLKIVGHTILEK